MAVFEFLRYVHVTCAVTSLAGFILRGLWVLRSDVRLLHRMTRVVPHVVDTILLSSALGMLYILHLNPFDSAWLSAKLMALIVYIVLGAMALRMRPRSRPQVTAMALAIICFGYIVAVAVSKTPLPGW